MAKIHQITNKVVAARVAARRPLVKKQREKRAQLDHIAAAETSPEYREIVAQAREHLSAFVNATNPWDCEGWQEGICQRLERLRYEKGQRIAIHAPPQLGKSIILSQRLPCWMLGHEPTLRVRLACYNQSHARKFSRVNIQLLRSKLFREMFPDEAARLPKQIRADEWSTLGREALLDSQVSFAALGLGSGFTGTGVDLLLIDDPYKSKAEAYSEIINQSIWDWWDSTAQSRLNPDTNIVVMFHRWKENDLAGRLIEEGGWEVIRMPALADGGPHDPTGRDKGESLSPARYPAAYYQALEAKTPFTFLALYQGTPTAEGGLMCKLDWLRKVAVAPRENMTYVRYWDKAGTQGGGKFTAGVLMARDEVGVFWVLDVVRGQWDAVTRERMIKETAIADARHYGFVATWVEEEPGSGGKESAENTVRNLAGYSIQSEKVTGDKVVRFVPFCNQGEAGNIRVLIADWTNDYIKELTKFPAGTYSDQVDGSSGALNKLAVVMQWNFG